MKNKSRIRKYIQSRADHLQRLIRKSPVKFTETDFHDLRVEIKKLNALKEILKKKSQQDKMEKYLRPWNELFDQAGKVRESQLAVKMTTPARKSKAINQYLHVMTADILFEQQSFFEILTPEWKKKIKRNIKKIKELFSHKRNLKIDESLHKLSAELNAILAHPRLRITEVHDVRKKLKTAYYLHHLFNPDPKAEQSTDEFQDLLGQWHDGRVQVRHLQDYIKKHVLNAMEKKSISALKDKLATQTRELYSQIQRDKKQQLIK